MNHLSIQKQRIMSTKIKNKEKWQEETTFPKFPKGKINVCNITYTSDQKFKTRCIFKFIYHISMINE